jgi:hypothetical protein
VSLDDCELFAELVTGDYWSLICAGYLFAEYGLSSFQMSVLLSQSFKKWEPDSDTFVWDEFLEKVRLNYCPSEDADLYPLSKRLQLKNQKQVCCSARVTVSGRQWENKSDGDTASVLPYLDSPFTIPSLTVMVDSA